MEALYSVGGSVIYDLNKGLSLFKCISLNFVPDGVKFIVVDRNIPCWSGTEQNWVL